jgi:hypothetical protein
MALAVRVRFSVRRIHRPLDEIKISLVDWWSGYRRATLVSADWAVLKALLETVLTFPSSDMIHRAASASSRASAELLWFCVNAANRLAISSRDWTLDISRSSPEIWNVPKNGVPA